MANDRRPGCTPRLAVLGAAVALMTLAASPDPLAAERGRHRLLLVFAPASNDARLQAQRAALQATQGVAERDLRVIEIVGDVPPAGLANADARGLRRAWAAPTAQFAVILVGKDGGAKLRSAVPLSATRLFDVIDRMPMRQQEMRTSGPDAPGDDRL